MATRNEENTSDITDTVNSLHESAIQESTSNEIELPILVNTITPDDDRILPRSEIPDSESDLDSSSPVKESPAALSEGQEEVQDAPVTRETSVTGLVDGQSEGLPAVTDCEVRNLEVTKSNDGEDVQVFESEPVVAVSDEPNEPGALATKDAMKSTHERDRLSDDEISPIEMGSESTFSTANTTDTEVKLFSGGLQTPLTNEGSLLGGDAILDIKITSSQEILNSKGNGDSDTLLDTIAKVPVSGEPAPEIVGPEACLSYEMEDVQPIQGCSTKDQTSPAQSGILTTFQNPETASIPPDFSTLIAPTADDDEVKQTSETPPREKASLPPGSESQTQESKSQPNRISLSATNPIPSLAAPTSDLSSSTLNSPPSRDVLMAELKNMKMASIQARNAALEAEIAKQRAKLEEITKELRYPAAETVKRHIKLLHDYNDIRDVGQGLIGLIADNRGVRIGELYEEFGVGLRD